MKPRPTTLGVVLDIGDGSFEHDATTVRDGSDEDDTDVCGEPLRRPTPMRLPDQGVGSGSQWSSE